MRFHPGQIVRAEVERTHNGRDEMRLYIFVYDGVRPNVTSSYLGEDGQFHEYAEMQVLSDPPMGLVVPHATKASLIESLLEHADAGEVKELRRALEVAEARVDKLIEKALQ